MKHIFYAFITLCAANPAVAENSKPINNTNCINEELYSFNSQCAASLIESSPAYKNEISNIFKNAEKLSQSDYAVATIKLYESERKIEVIAHGDSN